MVVEVAKGIANPETHDMPESKKNDIIILYTDILGGKNPAEAEVEDLLNILKHNTLLERFAYRKHAGLPVNNKEFIKLKGSKGQLEGQDGRVVQVANEQVGFKCLHYSVTESNGKVEITIVKKVAIELQFGYRTIEGSAKKDRDFKAVEEIVTMDKRDTELIIQIPIIDDNDWEPDLEFYVELFNPMKKDANGVCERMIGDDSTCKITILDEDFLGTLAFECTDVKVHRGQKQMFLKVIRSNGADGEISCRVRTEDLDKNLPNAAEVFEHFIPLDQKITFAHGEIEQTVKIDLICNDTDIINGKTIGKTEEEDEEHQDLIFNVKLLIDSPPEVKISKKNCCLVTIVAKMQEEDDKQKLYEYFISQKEPSWSQQFKMAV